MFHTNEVPQHKCNICSYQTLEKGNLKAHVENIHKNAQQYVTCTICKKLMRPRALIYHQRIFHSKEVEKNQCNFCPFQTPHKGNLKAHIKSFHTQNRVTCPDCNKTLTPRGLRYHSKIFHNKEVIL